MMRAPKILVLLAAAALCLSLPAHAYIDQEDITKRWGIGLNISAAIPNDSDPEANIYYGGNFTYGVMDYLALQIDMGFQRMSYSAFGLDFGDLNQVPLIFSLQPRYPFEIGTTPAAVYGLLGAGVVFFDFNESDTITGLNREVAADDAFAFRLGLGMDWFLTRNFATNIEASYTFVARDVTLTSPPGVAAPGTVDVNTDFYNIGAGIKYYFD